MSKISRRRFVGNTGAGLVAAAAPLAAGPASLEPSVNGTKHSVDECGVCTLLHGKAVYASSRVAAWSDGHWIHTAERQVHSSARMVLGGVAPTLWRLPQVEAMLSCYRISPELAVNAGQASPTRTLLTFAIGQDQIH